MVYIGKLYLWKNGDVMRFKVELIEKNDYFVIDSEGISVRGINNFF